MNEMGFYVGLGTEGREKVRQKFANLQKIYIKYFDLQRTTGQGKISLPKYFDELDEILGDKHKVNPAKIIDSAAEAPNENFQKFKDAIPTTSDFGEPQPSTSRCNRFENISPANKKAKTKSDAMQELVSIQKQSQKDRKEEFGTMMQFFQETNESRHQQIMALIGKLEPKQNKKRKRHDSTSSSD